MTWYIGDVHGKNDAYKRLIRAYPNSIQVGDMGVGFKRYAGWQEGAYLENPPHYAMVQENARFIRGNHDNPFVCRNHSQWIADGSIEGDTMFIGGAYSIDKDYRQEGYDWWPEEELSQVEMLKILEIFTNNKPRIMVTHDCPECLLPFIVSHHMYFQTRTGQFFDRLFETHKPAIWLFGHHHIWFDQVIQGTRFICIPELGVLHLDEKTLDVIKVI